MERDERKDIGNRMQTFLKGEQEDWEWLTGEVGPKVLKRVGTAARHLSATAEYTYWHSDILAQVLKEKLERDGRDALVEAQKAVLFVARHPDRAVRQALAPAVLLLWAAACAPAPSIPQEPTPVVTPFVAPTEAPVSTRTPPESTATLPPPPPPTETATKPPEPTKAPTPTERPTLAPTPTEVFRPAPAVVALYGNPEKTIDFRTLPPTRNVFFNERTWANPQNVKLGAIQGFSYLGFQTEQDYNLFREGKPTKGGIYHTSSINFFVKEIEMVDPALGIFLIRSEAVNAGGAPVTLQVKMNGKNPVYMHIPESDKSYGGYFCLFIGPDGPIGANAGIVRVGDVIGFGAKSPATAEWIKGRVDAAVPGKTEALTAVDNQDAWLMIYPH